jgi:hypothetical protein
MGDYWQSVVEHTVRQVKRHGVMPVHVWTVCHWKDGKGYTGGGAQRAYYTGIALRQATKDKGEA